MPVILVVANGLACRVSQVLHLLSSPKLHNTILKCQQMHICVHSVCVTLNQLRSLLPNLLFDLLGWWENAGSFMSLRNRADKALNALTFQVTTSVAAGSFRAIKRLLTDDRRSMNTNTQIGYVLTMVNGNVNERIPESAQYFHRNFPCFQCSMRGLCYCPPPPPQTL